MLGELGGELRQLLTAAFRPVVVPVLREKLAPVQRDRGMVGTRRPDAPGLGGGALEPIDVDVGDEMQLFVADDDRVPIEGAAGDIDRLMEVVRGCGRLEIPPQDVHRLLAVEAMPPRERQQLHQLAGLLQPPGGVRDRDAFDRRGEAAEERHADVAHPPRISEAGLNVKGGLTGVCPETHRL